MTVGEFLEMCTQDWIKVDFFDCENENETTTAYIGEVREDILDAEMMSWDIDNGRICINYVK